MRKILHADCDCFYAAVEMRDDPSLTDIPIAIGGSAERRGVVATSNYPARRFGVRSAMATAHALRLCPTLKVISPDFVKYQQVSQEIQAIFHELTPHVEPLSLDEAFLDVSEVTRFSGSGTWMARWLKDEVKRRTGIAVSVGVAPNKFLAKIASDWRKPDGLFVIAPHETEAFVAALPVNLLPGVGPATMAKLSQQQITTCAALRTLPLNTLVDQFGKFGQRLFELARGIDDRIVAEKRERKSISVETTYPSDIETLNACQEALQPLMQRLDERIQRHGAPDITKLFVKVKFDNFSHTTMECGGYRADTNTFMSLLEQAWARQARPVRLLGVGVRLASADTGRQLTLFEPSVLR